LKSNREEDIKMEELLKELEALLEKHSATIIRSGDDEHKLVLSILTGNGVCMEEEFEEDIDVRSIKHGWHKTI
jgi:hypothetical protein